MEKQDLDAAVASEVMCWHEPEKRNGVYYNEHGEPRQIIEHWKPLLNDADACRVLDRLIEFGYRVSLCNGGKDWRCVITTKDYQVLASRDDASRRLAIVHAALAAARRKKG